MWQSLFSSIHHSSSCRCVGCELLGPSLGLALPGPAQGLFKRLKRFVM
ncbi:hypothetical protein A4K52_001675 [Salmonella enterica subsp. arizonae]|nr:hypothetical protein [Salmonella enterica subsp. arizonae]